MIGVFDSGVGGLTVVKEIIKKLPEFQIIYFGDTARLPYGTKGEDFVKKYSEKITRWLLDGGAKVIVIACHTSSAWAASFLKEKFNNIPIFEMIDSGAKEAYLESKSKRIGIIGTPGTIKSGAWQKKLLAIDPKIKVFQKACPLFVPLAEEGWQNKKIAFDVAKDYLFDLKKKNIDVLVLACTHYPILEKPIRTALGKGIKIINPAESLARELQVFFEKNIELAFRSQNKKDHKFFFSDQPYNLKELSKTILKLDIVPEIKDPF
jgi:glutamate racemase